MSTKRITTLIVALAVAGGCMVTAAPSALAVTGRSCSGNTCNGLDPNLSYTSSGECGTGAMDAADLPHGEYALGGLLELRWGPNCGTNWTRFTPADNDMYEITIMRLSDRAWAGTGMYNGYFFSNAKGVSHYSDQIYVPGNAEACVFDVTTNAGPACFQQ
jgi:hypothetical protein